MNCVVLAGGRGIRLSPLTDEIPKPLIEFKKKSLIDYLIEIIYDKFKQIIIVVDYLAYKIQQHFSNSEFSEKLIFVHQDPEFRGTMGALLSAKHYINGDFLTICSDNLYDPTDIELLLETKNSFLIKRVSTFDRQEHYRNAKISLIRNPEWHYLEAGAWYLERGFIDLEPVRVAGTKELGIPQTIFKDFQENSSKYKVVFANFWYPIGTHWELDYANANIETLPNTK